MTGDADSRSRKGWRVVHALWAVLAVAVSLVLVFTKGGHPPMIVFVPIVLIMWAVGHTVVWGVGWLAARGRHIASEAGREGEPWPAGLRLALVPTGVAGLIGIFQLLMTALEGGLYPYHYASEWVMMLAVWAVHGVCFGGLLLRRRWSRPLSAMLAFGWALLLASQIVEHLPRKASSDITGLLILFGLLLLVVFLGLHLVASRKIKAFLAH